MTSLPIRVDLHNHTLHSHAKDTVSVMAAAACAQGLDVFGFSEHSLRPAGYAYPVDYQPRLEQGFPAYIHEVFEEQERYRGRMEVLLGLEMDYMPDEEAFARRSVSAHPYAYVIGGLHFQGHWGFDFTAADWEEFSDAACSAIFVRYYTDMKRMADTGLFQIAAHPDLIKLFRKTAFDAWVRTETAHECIRTALLAIKNMGMAMEVSSAALRKGLGEPYPGPVIMELARDIGVPVSFGSDAHAHKDVAFGFETLAAYARRFGYTRSAIFRNKTLELRPFG